MVGVYGKGHLGMSLAKWCSLLEGLRFNYQSSNHLKEVTKELWKAVACFRVAMSFASLAFVVDVDDKKMGLILEPFLLSYFSSSWAVG